MWFNSKSKYVGEHALNSQLIMLYIIKGIPKLKYKVKRILQINKAIK